MKVSFTQKEYARLSSWAPGLWVAGARRRIRRRCPSATRRSPKGVQLAETFGCADLVEVDVNGQYFPNEKLTEASCAKRSIIRRRRVLERNSSAGWRNAICARARTDEARRGVDDEEEGRLATLEDCYWREFEGKGVEHLVVLRGGKG